MRAIMRPGKVAVNNVLTALHRIFGRISGAPRTIPRHLRSILAAQRVALSENSNVSGIAVAARKHHVTKRDSPSGKNRAAWLPWMLGVAVLAAVIGAALHFTEERDFIEISQQANPWWLLVALLSQIGTYVAQGEVWRYVDARAGSPISFRDGLALSLAKLFADQALPSAGISGSIIVSRALEHRGLPSTVARAVVLINIASYHAGYTVALSAALVILEWSGHAALFIVLSALLFIIFAVTVTSGVIGLAGDENRLAARIQRFPPLRASVAYIQGADSRLIRSPKVLAIASALQIAIIALDSSTMWVLLRSLGAHPTVTGVFASFMIASLVRTIGIVPGGLGTFEATSVLTLAMTGITVPVALSATLLFRGLSFWLPMLPGLWMSRVVVRPDHHDRWIPRGA
jgi:Mg2+-importing ATPase